MNFDLQTVFNLALGGAMSVLGWFARELWSAVKDVRDDVSKLREELPKTYITKSDFRDGVNEIKALLMSISDKLDKKADKP